MSSSAHGIPASEPEVTNVSGNGIWLLSHGKELFLPYEEFPWFKDAPIGKVMVVREVTLGHFYWPELGIDLGLKSIENPDKFPLKANADCT